MPLCVDCDARLEKARQKRCFDCALLNHEAKQTAWVKKNLGLMAARREVRNRAKRNGRATA